MNKVIFKKRLKDGNFLTARYDAKHNKNGGMIAVMIMFLALPIILVFGQTYRLIITLLGA